MTVRNADAAKNRILGDRVSSDDARSRIHERSLRPRGRARTGYGDSLESA